MTSVVEEKAEAFTAGLQDTLLRVFGERASGEVSATLVTDKTRPRMHVRSDNAILLQPRKSAKDLLALEFEFYCAISSSSGHLSVLSSSIAAYVVGGRAPLFKLDSLVDARSVPAAHWNVFAKRDELVQAMRVSGRYAGNKHARALRKSNRLASGKLHFPVGGWRFRPCLEDVIEMLITEFDLRFESGGMEVLAEKRREWRRVQLAAAVSDHPEAASAALSDLGYEIKPPAIAQPERVENTSAI